ncbi:hypothetical protein DL768_005793 [Monosporascus sp. mg162]|nr:hypothetical protein DL768_005793 [Monosporascus sp. mg162]
MLLKDSHSYLTVVPTTELSLGISAPPLQLGPSLHIAEAYLLGSLQSRAEMLQATTDHVITTGLRVLPLVMDHSLIPAVRWSSEDAATPRSPLLALDAAAAWQWLPLGLHPAWLFASSSMDSKVHGSAVPPLSLPISPAIGGLSGYLTEDELRSFLQRFREQMVFRNAFGGSEAMTLQLCLPRETADNPSAQQAGSSGAAHNAPSPGTHADYLQTTTPQTTGSLTISAEGLSIPTFLLHNKYGTNSAFAQKGGNRPPVQWDKLSSALDKKRSRNRSPAVPRPGDLASHPRLSSKRTGTMQRARRPARQQITYEMAQAAGDLSFGPLLALRLRLTPLKVTKRHSYKAAGAGDIIASAPASTSPQGRASGGFHAGLQGVRGGHENSEEQDSKEEDGGEGDDSGHDHAPGQGYGPNDDDEAGAAAGTAGGLGEEFPVTPEFTVWRWSPQRSQSRFDVLAICYHRLDTEGDDKDGMTRSVHGMNDRMLFLGAALNTLKTRLGIQNVTAVRSKRAAKGTQFSEMEHISPLEIGNLKKLVKICRGRFPAPEESLPNQETIGAFKLIQDKEGFSPFMATTDHMADFLAKITERINGVQPMSRSRSQFDPEPVDLVEAVEAIGLDTGKRDESVLDRSKHGQRLKPHQAVDALILRRRELSGQTGSDEAGTDVLIAGGLSGGIPIDAAYGTMVSACYHTEKFPIITTPVKIFPITTARYPNLSQRWSKKVYKELKESREAAGASSAPVQTGAPAPGAPSSTKRSNKAKVNDHMVNSLSPT